MRHLPWTHRIDVHWLLEVFSHERVEMRYVNTKQQAADLMTKALSNPEVWSHLLELAQIRPGIESATTKTIAGLIAAPPGLALPLSTAQCPTCNFDITTPGSQCPCMWT